MRGRLLFEPEATYPALESLMEAGATIKSTTLSNSFSFADYLNHYSQRVLPLAVVTENGRLMFFTADNRPSPKAGQTVIGLISADGELG